MGSQNCVERCEAGPHQYLLHFQIDQLSQLKLEELRRLRLRSLRGGGGVREGLDYPNYRVSQRARCS